MEGTWTCSDFSTQEQAQEVLDRNLSDPHNLDHGDPSRGGPREPLLARSAISSFRKRPELRFRVLLTDGAAERVELART